MVQTARDIWMGLTPDTQKYYIKKGAVVNGQDLTQQTPDWLMGNINKVNQVKGGQKIYDPSQIDSAAGPLIAQRNKRGLSGLAGVLLPVAAGFLAGPLGAGLAGATGLGTAAATGLAGAGLGGLSSALTGGDFLKGAAMGGISGFAGGGGFGSSAGSTLANATGNAAMQGPTAGSGLLGSLTRGGDTLSSLARTGASALNLGGASSSAAGGSGAGSIWGGVDAPSIGGVMGNSPLSTILSGYQQYQTQNDIEEKLKRGQQQALNSLSPYLASGYQANRRLTDSLAAGFDPSNLANDAGYQFRLGEGQKGLERSLAAQGMGQSGAALKAAQEYGQNFAKQEYQDAYSRWMQENGLLANQAGQGVNVAGAAGDIYSNMGDISAQATGARNNALQEALARLLARG